MLLHRFLGQYPILSVKQVGFHSVNSREKNTDDNQKNKKNKLILTSGVSFNDT